LVGKSEGKRPLGRPRRRWEDITMNLREIGWRCEMNSSGSGQGPGANPCEYGNESSGPIKGGEILD
jgi:hypothetical protein